MEEYIKEKLPWRITCGRWPRTLGADVKRGADWIELSADALIDSLVRELLLGVKITPNMPYTQGITS
eukprot:1509604-Prymnesium_polylepis.1